MQICAHGNLRSQEAWSLRFFMVNSLIPSYAPLVADGVKGAVVGPPLTAYPRFFIIGGDIRVSQGY